MKLILTWQDFDRDMDELANIIATSGTHNWKRGLYGAPRGGLVVAVALSHRLEAPFLIEQVYNAAFVDDILETGKTYKTHGSPWHMAPFFWINKSTTKAKAVRTIPLDRWVVFPWEVIDAADKDAAAYYERRP